MFTITEKAIEELKNILNGSDMPGQAAIRVFAQSGGGCCSSNQLGIEIADMSKTQLPGEDFGGLKVLIDEETKDIASNATIDFYDHEENPGFKVLWKKDHQHGGCGCH
jgi:Fe-S cluster assembly iron-binding protein IscA